ncbi:MAG: putative aminohydrolase SsnA [Chloroflexota bacterium]
MLITNGKVITWEKENRVLENYAIYVEDGKIRELGPQVEMDEKYPDVDRLDAQGQYILPGSIVAHTHFYGAFARGMAIPGPAPKDFPEILDKLWWPLDMALDEEAVRFSALIMLVDAIKHGATTLIDHHASPNFIDGSMDVIADAVDEAGVRAALCYEVTDRNGEAGAKAGIQENVRFIKSNYVRSHSRLAASFGLHASLTLTASTLDACQAALPEGAGFHIHVAEHQVDQYDSLEKYGLRTVDRLHKHGILGPNSIVAHAIHIDAREAKLLAESNTWVTHQARSNMNNAVGAAGVESLLRLGIPVCLGTDGFSSTMWDEWKTVYLLHKVINSDPRRMNGMDVMQMGIYNNAALAEMFFPEAPLGVIVPDAQADLIFVDYHPHTPLTVGNLPWQIIFGFNESMITTTIVEGKILMRERKLLTLDEEAIAAHAREMAPKIWQRYENYVGRYSS